MEQPRPAPQSGSRSAGFSLIELLVVIAIIGILAAIMIPIVGSVRSAARTTQCLSNLRQIGVGIQLYVTDQKGRLPGPIYSAQSPNYRQTSTGTKGNIAALLAAYLPSKSGGDGLDRAQEMLACPAWSYATPTQSGPSMIMNAQPAGWTEGGVMIYPLGYADPFRAPMLQSQIQAFPLSRTWLMMDADKDFWSQGGGGAGWISQLPLLPAHRSVRNVLFYDYHVESASAEKRRSYFSK